jgi:hypothetical protein
MPVWIDPVYGTRPVEITTPTAEVTTVSEEGIQASGAPGSAPATRLVMLNGTTVATTSVVLDRGSYRGPAALVIANIGGSTPTETIDIQGSVDNINFYNCAYALVATPNTVAVAQITVTTTATTTYLLVTDQAWRFLRVVTGTITNEQTWVTYYQ